MCPYIPDEALNDWKLYKKYPVSDDFMAWQKTDEATGKNPYFDRYRCLTEVLDMNKQADRYSLGRALYHIAQRRGFLSNRKEAAKESDGAVKAGIKDISNGIMNAGCEYLGEYFYKIYGSRQKIRNSYTSRIEHYKKEFDATRCVHFNGYDGGVDALHGGAKQFDQHLRLKDFMLVLIFVFRCSNLQVFPADCLRIG